MSFWGKLLYGDEILTYSKKLYFKSLFSSLLIFSVFIAAFCGFYKNEVVKTEEKAENIPYYNEPESVGIIIKYNQTEIFLGLDFTENKALFIFDEAVFEALKMGYKIDYSYTFSQAELEDLVDSLGGIELSLNDENLNLTGNQVSDWIAENLSEENLKILAENISKKIAKEGIDDSQLEELFENNSGTLTLRNSYLYSDYLKEVFENPCFIE